MCEENPSVQAILEDLLLNQALSKEDIARITTMSIRQINLVLFEDPEVYFKEEQLYRLNRLYKRLKAYEGHLQEYLIEINIYPKDL